jgi:hypothetical protein
VVNELVTSILSRRYGQVRGRAKELVLQTREHKTWIAMAWKDGDNPFSRDLEELPPGEIHTIGDLLPYLATSVQKDVYEFQAHLILFTEDTDLTQKNLQQYQKRREAILVSPELAKLPRGRGKKLPPLPPSPTPPLIGNTSPQLGAIKKEKGPVFPSRTSSYDQMGQEVSPFTRLFLLFLTKFCS